MERAARFIAEEAGAAGYAARLLTAGFSIVTTGHSLGAGVAVLLAVTLRRLVPGLRATVFAFATPAAVDAYLAQELARPDGPVRVTSLVNRDDVVPRASAKNLRELAHELDLRRKEWEPLLREDVAAIKSRAKNLFAPRDRERMESLAPKATGFPGALGDEVHVTDPSLPPGGNPAAHRDMSRTGMLLRSQSVVKIRVESAEELHDVSHWASDPPAVWG